METGVDAKTENAIRIFLAAIAPRYAIAGAILYGSRARGTHRPDSDADLAVLISGEHDPRMPTALAMADVAYDVLLEIGVNISPSRSGSTNGSTQIVSRTPSCWRASPGKASAFGRLAQLISASRRAYSDPVLNRSPPCAAKP